MKRLVWTSLFAMLIVAGASSCKKIIKALFKEIDVELTEVRITVPANPIAPPAYNGDLPFPTITQQWDLDSLVRANTSDQFGLRDVTSLKLKAMTINIVEGADQDNNLQNFENLRLGFSSSKDTSVTQIASFDFPDTYATTANANTSSNAELISYLSGNELYYDLTVKPRRITTRPMTIVIKATVTVK